MGSLAADTRTAVDESPFLRAALRAGVLNFAAAARYVDVDGDEEAIATALRRYADELPPLASTTREVRVQMQSGVEPDILALDGTTPDDVTDATAIIASGEVDATFFADTVSRLVAADVTVFGAGFTADTVLVLVPRRRGAKALRLVEEGTAGPS